MKRSLGNTFLLTLILTTTLIAAEPKRHSAVNPAHRFNWWGSRHEAVLERVAKGDVDLLMIGDSITHGWEKAGKKLWQKYYAPRKAVNMGFGGDRTQHVLWRLENGEIDGIRPKLAVIMIGTNNSNRKNNTAEEITDGIKAICWKLRKELPEMKILILAIFPRAPKPCPQRAKNEKASELASKLADGRMIHYLDINKHFLTEDGTLTKEIMPDFLHPNKKGYEIWAKAMEPKIAELMGEKNNQTPDEQVEVGKNTDNNQWPGHTRPDKWKEPRVFHLPAEQDSQDWLLIKDRISISRIKPADDSQQKVFSPHKVYWYFAHEDSQESQYFKSTFTINIFNERDYLVQLSLRDIYKNYVKKVDWINEKLLYIQVWWGRALGTYIIFDVEKEKIIYKEMVRSGSVPFWQWQQSKEKNEPDCAG